MLKTYSLPVLLAMAVAVPAHAQNQLGQDQQRNNQLNQRQINQQQQQRPAQQRRDQNQAQASNQLDNFVAKSLLIANQEEIELAQFAMQHAQSQEVKQFAQQLVNDHQALGEKLNRIAGDSMTGSRRTTQIQGQPEPTGGNLVEEAVRENREELREERAEARETDGDREGVRDARQDLRQARQDARQERRDATQPGQPGRIEYSAGYRGDSVTDQIHEIQKKASQECMSRVKEMLQSKQGEDFDQAFLGQQIGMHVAVISMVKASQDEVSGELQQVLQETQPKLEQHLEKAKSLMESKTDGQNPQQNRQQNRQIQR